MQEDGWFAGLEQSRSYDELDDLVLRLHLLEALKVDRGEAQDAVARRLLGLGRAVRRTATRMLSPEGDLDLALVGRELAEGMRKKE